MGRRHDKIMFVKYRKATDITRVVQSQTSIDPQAKEPLITAVCREEEENKGRGRMWSTAFCWSWNLPETFLFIRCFFFGFIYPSPFYIVPRPQKRFATSFITAPIRSSGKVDLRDGSACRSSFVCPGVRLEFWDLSANNFKHIVRKKKLRIVSNGEAYSIP